MAGEFLIPPRISGAPALQAVPPRLVKPPRLPWQQKTPPAIPRHLQKPAILTPAELERFKNLLVFARATVEGYFSGKHKSPFRGSSVEFADYKEYVPGDEVNRIDWRAYGRTRRLFVRQFEAETDMMVYLLVDVSASMSYAGGKRQSKYLLAARIAAALAYLMTHQGDKAALGLFAAKVNSFLPPGGTRRHLHNLVTELERVQPAATTGIAHALQECNSLFKKRGRIVILSDFWTDTDEFLDALGQFLHRKFEVLLLHVVDPDELDLPPVNVARFQDMETGERVEVEPEEIRATYRETVRAHIDRLAGEANSRRVSHALVNTRNPYIEAIEAYLGFRGKQRPTKNEG
ncbi:MAG: DUF58 domain-containing protein [Verrucomicrobia bacterium]|nr:DUF58 domain-containing protein [Verrucomicrobiota bacterium]